MPSNFASYFHKEGLCEVLEELNALFEDSLLIISHEIAHAQLTNQVLKYIESILKALRTEHQDEKLFKRLSLQFTQYLMQALRTALINSNADLSSILLKEINTTMPELSFSYVQASMHIK